jgi:hypothetical protein
MMAMFQVWVISVFLGFGFRELGVSALGSVFLGTGVGLSIQSLIYAIERSRR